MEKEREGVGGELGSVARGKGEIEKRVGGEEVAFVSTFLRFTRSCISSMGGRFFRFGPWFVAARLF